MKLILRPISFSPSDTFARTVTDPPQLRARALPSYCLAPSESTPIPRSVLPQEQRPTPFVPSLGPRARDR